MEIVIISAVWCPSCLSMKKVYKEVENKFQDVTFKKLDYDFDDVSEYNVSDILPVLILKKDGIELKRIIGERESLEIIKEIGDVYEK